MTEQQIADIRQQLANRDDGYCSRCGDRGKVAVRRAQSYITDSAEERAACWHDETCPQCGGIANRAVGLLPELLDALETARAGGTDPGTDAEQEGTRFIANELAILKRLFEDREHEIATLTRERDEGLANHRVDTEAWAKLCREKSADILSLTSERDIARQDRDSVRLIVSRQMGELEEERREGKA